MQGDESPCYRKMALYYDLQVYKDTKELVELLYGYTQQFPREHKFALGQDLKRDSIQLIRHLYRANKQVDKKEHLEQFMDEFELVKFQIHLAHTFKLLSTKQYGRIIELVTGIGKQITGWRNATVNARIG